MKIWKITHSHFSNPFKNLHLFIGLAYCICLELLRFRVRQWCLVAYFPVQLDLVTEYWLVFIETDVIFATSTIDPLQAVDRFGIELHIWDHPESKNKNKTKQKNQNKLVTLWLRIVNWKRCVVFCTRPVKGFQISWW